jgi:hypothetical protein
MFSDIGFKKLVRVHEATHTIFNTKNVVVHGVNVILEVVRFAHETSGIETREVKGTRRLQSRRVEAERESVEAVLVGTIGVRHVVVGRNHTVVRIGELEVRNIRTVDLELDAVTNRVNTVGRNVGRRQILDRVVEVEFLHLGQRGRGLLNLCDQDLLRIAGQHLTFGCVEVHVVRVALDATSGAVNVHVRRPADAEFHIVVLKGDQRESRLPVFAEAESERVELGRTTVVERTRRGLGETGRHEIRSDVIREEGILFIDDLATDQEFNLVDHSRPVKVFRRVGCDGGQVHVTQEITLAFETNRGHATLGKVALDDLTFDSLGKIRVTLVGRAEETHFRIADEMSILGTDGHELSDTTRHFIV